MVHSLHSDACVLVHHPPPQRAILLALDTATRVVVLYIYCYYYTHTSTQLIKERPSPTTSPVCAVQIYVG